MITAVDYHTAGEPFRIVTGGVDPIPGRTILEKRRYAAEHLDWVRELLVYEPRGHADMYGCFVVEPEDEDGDLGVVFFHNAGYSTACGHGTIALATRAVETGMVAAREPETELTLDVPSGRLAVTVAVTDGAVGPVRFRNVPAWVLAEDLEVDTSRGRLRVDVAYGGAFYASVGAHDLGLDVEPRAVPALIEVGREIKRALEAEHEIVNPDEPELRDLYGVVFYQDEAGSGPGLRQRNVTVFADGEVDRSPCGSGTSARLALLDRRRELPRGERLTHVSVIGSEFEAYIVDGAAAAGREAVVTEIAGTAHLTGYHEFVLEPDDELGTGFLLR
ncbi:MAG: proline racemase family protein [Thermoleophilia bacterium]|nr:proline racemase family protein [Thermoleophilia bacterium]MDQ3858377.1 proline racemase family protein [Actinomycetota bacterium]